jgi:hypothetical protein
VGVCLTLTLFLGMSTYIPAWMKRDAKRFPRAHIHNPLGGTQLTEVLSLFHESNVDADIKAFSALMAHIKQVDEEHGTIIMVQVENEVGLLGASRDLSKSAEKVYQGDVPSELTSAISDKWDIFHPALKDGLGGKKPSTTQGSWGDIFGTTKRADEVFMAYHYAKYINRVTAAGKDIYPLPMYTNCWLSSHWKDNYEVRKAGFSAASGGEEPGVWPSGGPNIGVLDIWIEFAPSLDFFSPDVYLHFYSDWAKAYTHRGQPLFIPEQRRDAMGLRWMWEAFGTYGALAASPFGIDSLPDVAEEDDDGESRELVKEHFGLLKQVRYYVLQSQANPGSCFGFWFNKPKPEEKVNEVVKKTTIGKWKLTIKRSTIPGVQQPAYGMVVPLEGHDDRFLLVGAGFSVTFQSVDEKVLFTGITHFDEKEVVDIKTGELKTLRKFNGDETMGGKTVSMPSLKPDAGSLPIAIFIAAGTRIAEVGVYQITEE